jgi:hypothetical protein
VALNLPEQYCLAGDRLFDSDESAVPFDWSSTASSLVHSGACDFNCDYALFFWRRHRHVLGYGFALSPAPRVSSDSQDVVVLVSASAARPVFQGTEPLDSAQPPDYVRLRVAELKALLRARSLTAGPRKVDIISVPAAEHRARFTLFVLALSSQNCVDWMTCS